MPEECVMCGCTETRACIGPDGQPCYWACPGWCSVCAEEFPVMFELAAVFEAALDGGGVLIR